MADDDVKLTRKDIEDTQKTLKELRALVESKDAGTAEAKGKIEKLEAALDKLEAKNQEVSANLAKQTEQNLALKQQADELEKKLTRPGAGATDKKEATLEMKAFEAFIKKGVPGPNNAGMAVDDMKYLRTDSEIEGGYLAPPEYVNEIIRLVTEMSPLRSYARVRKTMRGEIEIPKRTSIPTASFRQEGGSIGQSNSNYGMVKIYAHHLDAQVLITATMLSDGAFNMESEINADVVEAFTLVEGQKFIGGTLPVEPEGILTNNTVQTWNSGIANDITADNFYDVQGEVKEGYNPAWVFNRRTLARIRKMKDGVGQYLFQPAALGGPQEKLTNSIAGDPYAIMAAMPDISANATPVAYGDWGRGYTILDGVNIPIIRDPYTQAGTGKIVFTFSRRVGGKVTLSEAIKKLTCSTNANTLQ